MKNKVMKVVSLVCCASMVLSMVGCGTGGTSQSGKEQVNESKAQLYVFNYNGGFGSAWLEAAAERFEALHEETVFVEGTKGVQVWVDKQKTGGDGLSARIPTMKHQVFFLENINYQNFVYDGLMLDITDLVTETLTEYGEERSIEDKLTEQQKNYYKLNGKYYGLPHYEGFNGISYDVDLFDKHGLFFNKNGEITEKSNSDQLSAGIDGIEGTYDDGLPRTYDEFYKLCDKMVSLGLVPITWSGYYQFYFICMLKTLAMNCAEEESMLFYDFEGETSSLIQSVDANGKITYKPKTTISADNGYEVYSHEALYYPLTFAQTIIDKGYYDASAFNGTVTHTDAQDNFLLSSFDPSAKDICMLVEGSWWQEEADATFKKMEKSYINAGRSDRRIGFMPLPKATEEQLASGKVYIADDNYTCRFINANCDESMVELAKTFLQFCCTDESLIEYTSVTGGTLGYDYQIPEEEYEKLDYFAQSVYTLKQNAEVIYPVSSKEIFYNNKTTLANLFDNQTYGEASRAMKNNGTTALEYFEAVKNKFSPSIWETMK